ncbi:LysR family transcriptional regulator [Streptomyces sp. NPDC050625]|uniref:LysR family transcriptional regulator n=1 Tax=Streptomyces sp. NPDC050625 TaxID=3154629 RepID=UPI003416A587
MEIRQLQCFVAVAEELNFTRAAERLHLSQSTVSATVRTLEKELRVRLFLRSSKHVALTSEGAALLPEAHAAISAVLNAEEAVRRTGRALGGTLTIGATGAALAIDFPQLLRTFHTAHPDVAVRLRSSSGDSAARLIRQLLVGKIDVALLALTQMPPSGVVARKVAEYPLVLVVPEVHRLAGRTSASLREVTADSFVECPQATGVRTMVDQAFSDAGVTRRSDWEAPDLGTVTALVGQGLGVSLVPAFAAFARGVRRVPLREPVPHFMLTAALSAERRPTAATEELLVLIDEAVAARAGSGAGRCTNGPAEQVIR